MCHESTAEKRWLNSHTWREKKGRCTSQLEQDSLLWNSGWFSVNISQVWPSTWLLHVSRSSSPSGGWPSLCPAAAWSTPASWAGTPEPAGTATGCPGTWPRGTAPRRAASSGSPPLHLLSSSERWRSRPSSSVAGRLHLLRPRVSVAGWSFWAAD